ncbi:hypothetical protein FE257_002876 [Aspergillus nanangensis]|uniref:C3H1-type domain-containing protein n=1 Tax=Aspergillus nanangensis TaxID=2582783 RepID=A0AAD4GXT7_ASPNN|nr:hypothetical protein FE257_002876 [Aspergillus nanangensis]
MEQSPPQDLMRGLPRAAPVNPASLPPDYWNTLDSLYSNDPPPQQQPPELQSHHPQQSQSQPLGIGWDHPVFNQRQSQQQSRNSLPQQQQQQQHHQSPPQDQSHGLYSSSHPPPSWRGTPLQNQHVMSQTPQGYNISSQYRPLQPYPQGQVTMDSRSIATPDSAAFPQAFAYPREYYPQHLSVPDTFPRTSSSQTARQQSTMSNPYQNDTSSASINPYSLPAGFPEDSLYAQAQFTNDFAEPTPNISSHQTINPQFLNPQQSAAQHQSLNNFVYMNPTEFSRQSDPKAFDYYRNDLQIPSMFNEPTTHNTQALPHHQAALSVNGHMLATQGISGNVAVDQRKKQPSVNKQTKKPSMQGLSKKVDGKGSGSSSSESDTDYSDLEIELPEEPSPIPPSRPVDPEAAVKYDTLNAVWYPRNRRPNADKVKSALVAFKDVVKTVRDTWKEKSQAMKVAENKNESDTAAKIKNDVVLQRRLMDAVVSTTLDKGHPMIVEKLGEHPMAVAAMYSFLLDRHQASDIDGAFNISLLMLLSRFVTMDEDVLQKTNVAKLLPRFVKKGGPKVKELAQKILDNAAASTKRKQDAPRTGSSKENSPSKGSGVDGPDGPSNEMVGSKRHREGESNGQPATKRMVVTSNPKNTLKPSNSVVNGPAKRSQAPSQESKVASVAAARPKANLIAPKPTNLFGSLSSASKRPGTSNAERAAAAAAAAKSSPPAEKKENPPPRPTFSFGDIMADLNKQKEPTPCETIEERPPETEEEREKRLRKEARRKLRVTWKPDHSLTEVRFFTHDPDEELGPGDRSREAGDVKGEGSVLKLHKNLDELGEDEDSGLREENLLDYFEPTEIDIEDIEDRNRNFTKRAGTVQADSPERIAQDHREATTLMVFYTSPADVPPTPKEPPPVESEESAPEVVSFGELPDHVKARQDRYFAVANPQRAPPPQQAPQNPSFDISNLLKLIQNAPQQPPPQQSTPPPAPQPAPQAPMSDLERTISMFRQQPTQPAPSLAQMPQFPAMGQPPATQGIDFQKILSAMNPQAQMPQPTALPQTQSQPTVSPNLAAIISQLSNPNAQVNPNPSQPPNTYEDPERKRMREGGGYDGHHDDGYGYPKRNKFNSAPNKRHPKAGLVACRYWAEGRCRKGDECTYRHDPLD